MDKILLIVPDWNLRQLYHELLFSRNIEVIPIDNIESGLPLLITTRIRLAIIYIDPNNLASAEVFLKVRQKDLKLLNIRVVLITSESETIDNLTKKTDLILNPDKLTPTEIVTSILQTISII